MNDIFNLTLRLNRKIRSWAIRCFNVLQCGNDSDIGIIDWEAHDREIKEARDK